MLQSTPSGVDPSGSSVRAPDPQAEAAGECARLRHLERAIAHARAELAQTRAELAGIRAGEQRALHQALHDDLTSLPNRRYFREQLEQQLGLAIASGDRSLAVMYLDLDAFKPINDLHGHAVGDQVLKIVAARLSATVRLEDLMSRLGGDEFACLLTAFRTPDELGQVASKLLETVAAPMGLDGFSVSIRPSVGIAVYPADGTTADGLLRSADTAMYRAKRQLTGYSFRDGPFGASAGRTPEVKSAHQRSARGCQDGSA